MLGKKSKIAAVKQLLTDSHPEPLTKDEISFLKHRKGLHYKRWITDPGLLVILPKDSNEVKQQVLTIARKMHCIVIVRRCDYKPLSKRRLKRASDHVVVTKITEGVEPVKGSEVIPEPSAPEVEQEQSKSFEMRFPGVFDDFDDDDENFRPYIIKNRICRN